MFTKWERKDIRSARKKPRWYETSEKPCFAQLMTALFEASQNQVKTEFLGYLVGQV
jgi:hypothetical protein